MKNQPIPLINGFYADETRPWSQQDVVNWLPCAAEQEGTRTPTMLKTPPGLSPFCQISATTQPVRGIYNAEGRLFAVMGSTLYQIRADGVAIGLGTIPGVGRVKFSHNQITNGNEVLIVNGSAGYIWNTVTSTLTRITDAGYPGAIDAVFIDGYFVQIEPARRFAFNSDLAAGMDYNTLDRFTSEVSPDLLVGMAVSNNELLLLSEGTGEFFENTGAAQQPFRSKRITFDKGAASRYGIATLDNTVMWLGSDGVFYLLDGYSPRRISTRPIEQMIRGLDWGNAFAFVWEDSGHSVCYWTFPDGRTIGYDASQQKWHRRASYGFERWRPSCMTRWQNQSIAGDFQCGRLWALDWAYPWEGDVEFVSEMTGPVLHDNQNLVQMPRLEVIMGTGQPEVAIRTFPAPIALAGNLPDGLVNDSGTLQYTAVGGSGTKTFSIHSGSLPPGASMDAAGLVTYTYTTLGNYSWVVRAADTLGNTADLSDSAAISQVTWDYSWTTYNDADVDRETKPVYAAAIATVAGFYSNHPLYSTGITAGVSASATLTNGGDGDWSPTLGRGMIVRSNTDRVWSSTDLQTWANQTQAVNLPNDPPMCWADDRAEFFGLALSGTGLGNALWLRSTNGLTLSTGNITANHPLNMQIVLRAGTRYFAFADSTPVAANRIAYATTGQDDWAFTGSVDTTWRDAKYAQGKIVAVGHISGTPASRKFITIDPATLTLTDVTPALAAGFDPSGVDYSSRLGLWVVVGRAGGSGTTSFYTSPTAAAGTWTERAALFPAGEYERIRWCDAPVYRFVGFRSGGVPGSGVVYSNTVLTPP